MTNKIKLTDDVHIDHFPNKDDWDKDFWEENYLIHLTAQDIVFAVNAANLQEAFDFIVDYAEEKLPGLLLSWEDVEETIAEGRNNELDELVYGGNHGRYLNTEHIRVEEVIRLERDEK